MKSSLTDENIKFIRASSEKIVKQNCEIIIADVQQQLGYNDCGIFSIAFATDLCFFGKVATLYNQCDMRKHLLNCFKEKKSPFPPNS